MVITKKMAAEKLKDYLVHRISLEELVAWAEEAMMDHEFDKTDVDILREVVGRLGVADVKAFGLLWTDCEVLLKTLGYHAKLEIVKK